MSSSLRLAPGSLSVPNASVPISVPSSIRCMAALAAKACGILTTAAIRCRSGAAPVRRGRVRKRPEGEDSPRNRRVGRSDGHRSGRDHDSLESPFLSRDPIPYSSSIRYAGTSAAMACREHSRTARLVASERCTVMQQSSAPARIISRFRKASTPSPRQSKSAGCPRSQNTQSRVGSAEGFLDARNVAVNDHYGVTLAGHQAAQITRDRRTNHTRRNLDRSSTSRI
jgi:hypothetical protein